MASAGKGGHAFVKSAAVIRNGKRKTASAVRKHNLYSDGSCMLDRIRDRFLADTQHIHLNRRIKARHLALDLNLHFCGASAGERLNGMGKRRT